MSDPKHIHLIGICGTAMASLAGMLKQRGRRVTGSDAAAYPPMSDFLRDLGIPVAQPFDPKNLEPKPDLVVVGNAISRGNVELEHILDQRIPFCSLPQLLHDEFLRGKEVLVVAGTHGKTTTTSMLAWIFHHAGLDPSFLIGGIAENFGSSFHLGQGKHFILEGDEYDTAFFDKGPKFLHYFPDSVILTSVEFDHADIYKDLDAVETAFKRLVNLVPRRGSIVAFDGAVGESTKDTTEARSMASSVCGAEPAFARIRRLRICQSLARLMPGLQTGSGSDLNRPGAIPKVPSGMFGTVATGLAARLREINLPQALGGLSVEQAIFRARKSQGPLLSKTTEETALTNNKLRTKNTTGN